jgi:RNA ligase (TIGR02306 family)
VPEGAVIPEDMLRVTGFWDDERDRGILAGRRGDRVKAVKLRGVLSQGILLDQRDLAANGIPTFAAGAECAEPLGITKYEPPIPTELAGYVYHEPALGTYTDVENLKRYPDVLVPGEPVVITEKLHGTCSIFSLLATGDGGHEFHVSSKGQAGKGLAIREPAEGERRNAYWTIARQHDVERKLRLLALELGAREVTLFGETVGVQDLRYGFPPGELGANFFDLRVDGRYVDADVLTSQLTRPEVALPQVPVLHVGPYDPELVRFLAEGRSTLADHVREGVVVRPARERRDDRVGRVILKHVGEGYLTRRGDATEFE